MPLPSGLKYVTSRFVTIHFHLALKFVTFAPQIIEVAKEIVVIIGGPGSGKTTLIDALTKLNFCCYPEISRQVIMQAREQGIEQLFLENPLLFSELLLEGRKKQHQSACAEASDIVFLDRGIPDVLAYMHYIGDSYPATFDEACKKHKYHRIFILPPWEEIYTSDEARYETYEQAKLLFEHLSETYRSYGYELHEVPRTTVAERVKFILNHLQNND